MLGKNWCLILVAAIGLTIAVPAVADETGDRRFWVKQVEELEETVWRASHLVPSRDAILVSDEFIENKLAFDADLTTVGTIVGVAAATAVVGTGALFLEEAAAMLGTGAGGSAVLTAGLLLDNVVEYLREASASRIEQAMERKRSLLMVESELHNTWGKLDKPRHSWFFMMNEARKIGEILEEDPEKSGRYLNVLKFSLVCLLVELGIEMEVAEPALSAHLLNLADRLNQSILIYDVTSPEVHTLAGYIAYLKLRQALEKDEQEAIRGLRTQAEQAFHRAVELESKRSNGTQAYLGFAYAHTAIGDFDKAEGILRGYLEKAPPDRTSESRAWDALGDILIIQGKVEAGIRAYQAAIAANPTADTLRSLLVLGERHDAAACCPDLLAPGYQFELVERLVALTAAEDERWEQDDPFYSWGSVTKAHRPYYERGMRLAARLYAEQRDVAALFAGIGMQQTYGDLTGEPLAPSCSLRQAVAHFNEQTPWRRFLRLGSPAGVVSAVAASQMWLGIGLDTP